MQFRGHLTDNAGMSSSSEISQEVVSSLRTYDLPELNVGEKKTQGAPANVSAGKGRTQTRTKGSGFGLTDSPAPTLAAYCPWGSSSARVPSLPERLIFLPENEREPIQQPQPIQRSEPIRDGLARASRHCVERPRSRIFDRNDRRVRPLCAEH